MLEVDGAASDCVDFGTAAAAGSDTMRDSSKRKKSEGHPRYNPNDIRSLVLYRMSLFTTVTDRTGQLFFQRRFKISLREYRLIGVVGYAQPISVSKLADECFLDKTQVSRTVIKLINQGYLNRTDADGEKASRGGMLRLTPKGTELIRQGLKYGRELNTEALAALSATELLQFSDCLDRLLALAEERYVQARRSPSLLYLNQGVDGQGRC
jgi:DNA-binding MarR family transcriptional regulator